MAGEKQPSAPGRGYEDVVRKQQGLGDPSGRGAPDERAFPERREQAVPGGREDRNAGASPRPEPGPDTKP